MQEAKKNQGFTLIELMITIAVLAIIATMAVPSMGNMINQKRLDTNTKELIQVLSLARSQAVLLKTNTTVSFNDNFTSTSTNFSWVPTYNSIKIIGIPSGYNTAPNIVFSSEGMMLSRNFVKLKQVENENGEKVWVADTVLIDGAMKNQTESYPRTIAICSEDLNKSKIITYSLIGTYESITDGDC
ncbi:pilus assembly FimT family protein [Acinetobacter terrestris]|uniref:pilus assembly FimT family protein n=1 Tax=Acinetobacter terrestris TaxID=2529843 RepID=UPI00103C44CD|nr:prepilin-type N-terminal cleavage/methylation domain-containing protein [Acinetobacter terrestris]TCB64482.1 prepilin-type N-terminal cleavage/methylation domain-containing protein [Acinetobacter terrestris]